MSIRVEATGRVTDAASPVSTEDGVLTVFVFDPFPEPVPAGTAHACEVRCRDNRLVGDVLRHGLVGASVAVSGELLLTAVSGPVEDELCAVRVSIEAADVCARPGAGPASEPTS
jgi:hypothetical protein